MDNFLFYFMTSPEKRQQGAKQQNKRLLRAKKQYRETIHMLIQMIGFDLRIRWNLLILYYVAFKRPYFKAFKRGQYYY